MNPFLPGSFALNKLLKRLPDLYQPIYNHIIINYNNNQLTIQCINPGFTIIMITMGVTLTLRSTH